MKPTTRHRFALAIVMVVTVLASLAAWPKGPDLDFTRFGSSYKQELKVRLGLDLQGGTHLVYQADLSQVPSDRYDDALAGVRDVIERRVNSLGVSEALVQTNRVGPDYRVIIELPGVTDVSEAIRLIGETPQLDFREPLVDDPLAVPQEDITANVRVEGEGDDQRLVGPDGQALDETQLDALSKQLEQQQQRLSAIDQNFGRTSLTGAQLKRATLQFDQQTQEPIVLLQFDADGTKLFGDLTTKYVGKPFAIYLDNTLVSAPVIQTTILGGEAQISGNFSVDEARQLAQRLNTGALPVPISLLSQATVGPTLGQASVLASFLAGVIGMLLVAVFMTVFYRLPGLVSVVALAIYSVVSLALFKLFSITLTLAGVAGFILSIGMAVDANVLIFENLKEQLRLGRPLKRAMQDGFASAWTAIRDSNISTLITCGILSWFGTSSIRGFAITLAIGVLVSMFSAITVTRTLLTLIIGSRERAGWWYGMRSVQASVPDSGKGPVLS